MSHCINSMAYVGHTPWHQLGHQLPEHQPIEVWAKAAGMDWTIESSPVHFCTSEDNTKPSLFDTFTEQKVLYRSDNHLPLSVVGHRYHVVQPAEVLSFYRDLTESAGYELETAGVLKSGRQFWALARTGQSKALAGNDVVNGYLLLATSCDGTLATTATPTTIRVVCHNTLSMALSSSQESVKVGHRSKFDANKVKQKLGMATHQWDDFMYQMKVLSERKVKTHEVKTFFTEVLSHPSKQHDVAASATDTIYPTALIPSTPTANERALNKVTDLFNGHGRGAQLAAAKNSAWGLLCSITEFIDHEKQARSTENRLNSAWFGQGALIKKKALQQALQLVA